MAEPRKIVSIMHACAIVGVSRRTIYNWLADKKIEYVRTPGGRVRIFADTLTVKPVEGEAFRRCHSNEKVAR